MQEVKKVGQMRSKYVRISEDLVTSIRVIAASKGVSVRSLLEELLRKPLEKMEAEEWGKRTP